MSARVACRGLVANSVSHHCIVVEIIILTYEETWDGMVGEPQIWCKLLPTAPTVTEIQLLYSTAPPQYVATH